MARKSQPNRSVITATHNGPQNIFELSLTARDSKPVHIDTSSVIVDLLRKELGAPEQEVVISICLDARGRMIAAVVVGVGTLTACLVHPREVFREAIRRNAASLILVHTHPSGDESPSEDDHELTERLRQAGGLLGIPLVDHIVLGKTGYFSYADRGLLSSARQGLA